MRLDRYLYQLSKMVRTLDKVSTGDPEKIARHVKNKVKWTIATKVLRELFRKR